MRTVRAAIFLSAIAFCWTLPGFTQENQTPRAPAAASPTGQAPTKPTDPCPQPPGMLADCGTVSEVPVVPPQSITDTKPLIDPKETTVLGELQIITINSKVYKNIRNLRVWLPANYFAPVNRAKHYPVLYMQDGQNLFDEATAVNHEWKFDETVQFLTGSMMIHPMIVVGIDSAPDPHQRAIEYLPYSDTMNPKSPAADEIRGKDYADFVVKEVMPLVEKKYRVAFGQANTGIGGSSYGATVSLYIALRYPTLFGKALIESPILEVGNGRLARDAETAKIFPQKIYIGVGTNEGRDAEISSKLVRDVQDLEKILRAKGLAPNRLKVVVEEGGHHDETTWSKRLQNALLFLYGSDIHLLK